MSDAGRDRIREDFDRIACAGGGDSERNDRFHDQLLATFPQHVTAALDVGCGTGTLTRRLAERAGRALGIDFSPGMIRLARERSIGLANLEFREADLLEIELPPESFDVIASVATLHHVPLAPALERLGGWLEPGGTLAVLDLMSTDTLADHLWGVVSGLRRLAGGRRVGNPVGELGAAWREHGVHDRFSSLHQVREAARVLPGAEVTRLPEWRYLLAWRKPSVPVLPFRA